MLLLVLVAGFLLAVGNTVTKSDVIYPNVSMNGIGVGKMTVDEAAERLESAASGDTISGEAVVVRFPGNTALEVTAEEAGLSVSALEAAELAYAYGRTGNLLTNAIAYLGCRFGGRTLEAATMLSIDEDRVRAIISDAVDNLSGELQDSSYEITEDSLILVKGRLGLVIDEDQVYEMIKAAFQAGGGAALTYEADADIPEEIDLQAVYDAVYVEPKNAVYDKVAGGVAAHTTGISFDIVIAKQLMDAADSGQEVVIPLILTDPEITSDYLKSVLFADLLAEKSTSLTSNSNRNTNIELSSNAINGTVLNPGDDFSFNEVVGQRTTEKGYKTAGAYANGETISAIGGGICQVSSTIYYTVLMADLEVVNRLPHSFTVSYLPLGMDATVSWGGPEFVFRNNTDFPIRITAYRDGLTVTIRLHGTKTDDHVIQLESVTLQTLPAGTKYVDDDTLAEGATVVESSGITGYVVDTYQNVYNASGALLERRYVGRSSYTNKDQVVRRGTMVEETAAPTVEPPSEAPTEVPAEVSEEPTEMPSETPAAALSEPPDAVAAA